MAAQKYGPPLVGCALQISETGRYKCDSFSYARIGYTCHGQAYHHREEGFSKAGESLMLEEKRNVLTDDDPAPYHDSRPASGL